MQKRRWTKNGCLGMGWLLILALAAGSVVAQANQTEVKARLEKAVNGPQRTPAYKKRDRYRHPLKTLMFFGIRPDMSVVEVIPGGGWYTEILAPFLRDQGQLVEATAPVSTKNPFLHKMALKYRKKLHADPGVYGKVRLEPFEVPDYMALGAPDSADMILTFRNLHDLIFANVHGESTDLVLQRFLRSAYLTLKPGGVLGIVAHRANPGTPVSKSHKLGRLPQSYVIREAEKAGFRLAATSEVNANPRDKRDKPVWTLPPSLHTKDKAHARKIGEADNMTLKFIKPGSH